MNKDAVLLTIQESYNLSPEDCDVLWGVANSNGLCEIEFPDTVSAADKKKINEALRSLRHWIELHRVGQQDVELNDESIDEFIRGMQPFISERVLVTSTGLEFNYDSIALSELTEMVGSLFKAYRKIDKVKSMLYWSLGDLCVKIQEKVGSIDQAIQEIASRYYVSKHSLRNAYSVAKSVPKHLRVDGLSYRHYMPLLKYAPALEYQQMLEIVAAIKKGKERRKLLSNGTLITIKSQLGEKSITKLCKDALGIPYSAPKKMCRYLVITKSQTLMSDEIPLWAIDLPGFVVVDLLLGQRLGRGGGEVIQFDPALIYSSLLSQEPEPPSST